jgi:chorismate synthase
VRPGHADLTGILKYDREDARDILERASARETTAPRRRRRASRAACSRSSASRSAAISCTSAASTPCAPIRCPERLNEASDASQLRTLDPNAEAQMIERIDAAKRAGNTLGGICEVVVDGLPVGLGSHVSWDRKLDGRIGAAILSIPAVKGWRSAWASRPRACTARRCTTRSRLAPGRTRAGNVRRATNNAGGLEGGSPRESPSSSASP